MKTAVIKEINSQLSNKLQPGPVSFAASQLRALFIS